MFVSNTERTRMSARDCDSCAVDDSWQKPQVVCKSVE